MKDFMLRFECFLTGYNYEIIKNSCEASRKAVKRFFSSVLIISILWGAIGYAFARRYLKFDVSGAIVFSAIAIFCVVNIERIIILSGKKNVIRGFRIFLGILMALIGSLITDQFIFREDIEKKKISMLQEEVNAILPKKTLELDNQIRHIDSAILMKEAERSAIIEELSVRPLIKSTSAEKRHFTLRQNGSNGEARDTLVARTDYVLTDIPNPKANLLPGLADQITLLRNQKAEKENSKINIRQEIEEELSSKTGFLDELNVLIALLSSSRVAMAVWIFFLLFFITIELFVVMNKFSEEDTDYDAVIAYQKDVKIKSLQNLKEECYQKTRILN